MRWSISYLRQLFFIRFILIVIVELTDSELFQSLRTLSSIFNLEIEKSNNIIFATCNNSYN